MNYLLDTKALIAFFNNEVGADIVEQILKEIDENCVAGFVSAITLTELYYIYLRRKGEQFAMVKIEQLKHSTLKVVAINGDIALKAGKYKVEAIPIADALIAASAHAVSAHVVTDDEHFELADVKKIPL